MLSFKSRDGRLSTIVCVCVSFVGQDDGVGIYILMKTRQILGKEVI